MTIEQICENLIDKDNKKIVLKAYEYACKEHAGMKRLSGDDFITHPLEVAGILTKLSVDNKTVAAALIHEVISSGSKTEEEIREVFGEDIAKIVDSLTKINKLELKDDTDQSAIYLRKILVGMAEDVRVIYIKLADRLHNMRTNWAINPAKQKEKAKETLNILVPIAHRLGMNWVKSELENLCLQYLKPDVYKDILEKLDASKKELTDDLSLMKQNLGSLLKENNIEYEIKGRVKSVYSIYNKLSNGKKWSDIYDILALRIFVNKESECYTVVGLIHSKYKPISKRFKDYVASPKENMYQSLHTTVNGENNKLYEIQIRTYEMDEIAEKGIASHVSYKEKNTKKIHNIMEQKLEMFRNIIEANNNDSDIEFEKNIENDFLKEVIYVYTPKGDVVELPKGATPIDFAYRIHSNVGDKTVGAIVNDVMVPFTHELNDQDIIKIKTSATAKPNKNWLTFVKTSQARNKIKSYFSKELRYSYIEKGKTFLEKELRKRKLSFDEVLNEKNITKILKDLKLNDIEELLLGIGSLRYTAGYIINLTTEDKSLVEDLLINKTNRRKSNSSSKGAVLINNESNIMVNMAKCCMPVKGDKIVGYITKSQGISIHKEDCKNIDIEDGRVLSVEWNEEATNYYLTKLYIKISEQADIIASLIELCTKKNANLVSHTKIKNSDLLEINIKVKDNIALEDLINGIYRIRNVRSVSTEIGDL